MDLDQWGRQIARKISNFLLIDIGFCILNSDCSIFPVMKFSARVNKSNININFVQHETRVEGEIQLEGSNASAEEADEGCDSSAVSGVDIILNHRLVETGEWTVFSLRPLIWLFLALNWNLVRYYLGFFQKILLLLFNRLGLNYFIKGGAGIKRITLR